MNKQKHIRILLSLMTLSAFISCNSAKEKTVFFPKDYLFPIDQIGSGKTFVYSNVEAMNQTSYKDLKLITESGVKIILSKQYSNEEKFDSSKTSVDNKLIETFTFMSPDNSKIGHHPIKGEIIEERVFESRLKFGERISTISYSGKENVVTIKSEEKYLKDTILTWQGSQLSCIVIRRKSTIGFYSKIIPIAKQELKYNGDSYYAKGIGLIRYTTQTKKNFSTWELIEIKDTK